MLSPDLALDQVAFAVVDVETTGLGQADRVVEVACVRLRGLREVTRFQSLVNPGIPIGPGAAAISGISDEMVSAAPIFPEIAEALDRLLEGGVFVAHNAPFDLQFLSRERRRWRLPPWEGPVLDTLRLARNTLALPGYSLGRLGEALSLGHLPEHRALADVLATAALLGKLLDVMDPPPRTLGDLLRAQEPVPTTWEACVAHGLAADAAALLEQAANGRQLVELEYQSRGGPCIIWVRPLAPEHNGPLFYLRAQSAEAEDERVFRIDRIEKVHLPGEPQGSRAKSDSRGDPS